MKDDLVSKAVVIDAICDEFSKVYCNNCAYKFVIGDLCDDCDRKNMKWSAERKTVERVVEELPSAQPGWIPCKTALPKENGQYIVTVKYEHVDGYEDIYSEHGEWVDGHWDAGWGHCGRVEKVLAWMELPTPYREGGQDGKN